MVFVAFPAESGPPAPKNPLFDPKTKVGAPSKPNEPWPFTRRMGDFWVTTLGPIFISILACGWPLFVATDEFGAKKMTKKL